MSTDHYIEADPGFTKTYIEKNYQRPETRTETLVRLKKDKRLARARKNGKRL